MRDYAYEDLEQEAAREQEENEMHEARCAEDDLELAAMAEIGHLGQFVAPKVENWDEKVRKAVSDLQRIRQKRGEP